MAALPIFPFVPGQGGGAPAQQEPAPPPDMGSLLGQQGTGGQPPQAPMVEDTTKAVMSQIGEMHVKVQDLARQFPAAASKAQEIGSLLVEMGMDIVRSLSGPESEPQAPRVLG